MRTNLLLSIVFLGVFFNSCQPEQEKVNYFADNGFGN